MIKTTNPEQVEAMRVEAERSELRQKTERLLRDGFGDVLSVDQLELRLEDVRRMKIVDEVEYERLQTERPNMPDTDGFIILEKNGDRLDQTPVVKDSESRADKIRTAMHEAVHVMAPTPVLIANPGEDPSTWNYSSYLGAISFERYSNTLEVDTLSIIDTKPVQRGLFWEAITDWLTDEMLKDELTDEEKEEVDTGGYIERHYIHYLVNKVSDRSAFVLAIKKAYTEGNEDQFRWHLHELTGRSDDAMYNELLDVLAMDFKKDWEARVDAWMEVVSKYLK